MPDALGERHFAKLLPSHDSLLQIQAKIIEPYALADSFRLKIFRPYAILLQHFRQ